MKKQPIIGARNRCFQLKKPTPLGPLGDELNIKVLEFNESTEDQMFKVFFVCFQYERSVLQESSWLASHGNEELAKL